MCREKEEDIEPMLEERREMGSTNENWSEQIKNRRKTLANLKRIVWLRKEKEEMENLNR